MKRYISLFALFAALILVSISNLLVGSKSREFLAKKVFADVPPGPPGGWNSPGEGNGPGDPGPGDPGSGPGPGIESESADSTSLA